ncbi:MAG TPA: cytochrome c1, partial [Burkholderiales bacterium]|nr:cytochrome c1 [Burkholderiales bacterium]
MVKNLLLALALVPLIAFSAEEGKLDTAPVNSYDKISLQRGVRIFVNYCLTCHNAAYMRYKRLEHLGLTDQQIKDNLMFAVAKRVGDTMTVAMDKNHAKDWFGATPPDLSVIARARGADWLYTYLR